MRRPVWILVALLVLGLWLWTQQRAPSPGTAGAAAGTASGQVLSAPPALPVPVAERPATAAKTIASPLPAFLPAEAHDVLGRIAQGGPFAYRQDGSVFQNRERRLPEQPRGYYHEYWYTDDHYRSFRRFQIQPAEVSP